MNIKEKILIEKLDDFGRGIAYINNKITFIKNALPEEIVDVVLIKENKKYNEAKVVNYIKKSKKRTDVKCPYYNNCGGCNLRHISYNDTCNYKIEKVKNLLSKFSDININLNIIKNEYILNYRNKIELKINDYDWGYYETKTNNFVSINECLLALDSINQVIKNKDLIKIKDGSIIIRSNYLNEILIVINSNSFININLEKLRNCINLKGIILNDKVYYGESYFFEQINDYKFKVNYNSFFQVNLSIAKNIIDYILDNVSGNNLLDLYCGVGVLGQSISKNFKKIYGIEINKNSIEDAKHNAIINKINYANYICGDTSKIIGEVKDKIDTIIIDPPRSGLVKNTIEDILKMKALNIIYISCNPVSLSRDLNVLKKHYNIEKISLFDMFSYTYHVECVCILKLK